MNSDAKKAENRTVSVDAPPQQLRPEELALKAMLPLEATTKSWRTKRPPSTLLDSENLLRHLALKASAELRGLVISISHDDYTKVPGGVQLCIQREQAIVTGQGFRYLQIHPWHPIPRLPHINEEPDTIIVLILDGKPLGTCRMSTLIEVTELIKPAAGEIRIVVHHLLGHLPEQVIELAKATGSEHCIFWLHDFFSLCPSYNLQRNNLVFCAAPPVTSNACMLCVYGRERMDHQKRMLAFFKALTVSVASPSQVTAEFWQTKSDLKAASVSVLPHMTLDIAPREQKASSPSNQPIVIGYLGAPAQHKGWPVFVNLMQAHAGSGIYRFVVMSTKRPRLGEDSWHSVHVTANTPTAMSDAVVSAGVDIVLHWPTWPETFSFTTFEALAGSAYVVTHPESGNVARAVEQTNRGAILKDEEDLFAFFRDGRAKTLTDHRRAANASFEIIQRHSDMSLPLIMKD